MKIGFIGLGNVGDKLAGSLLRNKFKLTVIDLDDSLVKDFISKGSETAKSPKELAEKVDLIGKESLLKIKDKKDNKKFVMLTLNDSKPGEPLLLHDEPIYCDGKIVGRTTSGNYSFNYEKNMSFGYLNLVSPIEELAKKTFFIEVEKKQHEAILQTQPLHDPENKIIKS